jgi:hypothetical protein
MTIVAATFPLLINGIGAYLQNKCCFIATKMLNLLKNIVL